MLVHRAQDPPLPHSKQCSPHPTWSTVAPSIDQQGTIEELPVHTAAPRIASGSLPVGHSLTQLSSSLSMQVVVVVVVNAEQP